jgi:integral membrane protein
LERCVSTPTSVAPVRPSTDLARSAFRVSAIVEACTWVGLLIGMAVKYLGSGDETGVHVFGPLHGAAFIAYVLATLWAAVRFGWPRGVILLGLAASIPPLATWAFDIWASRSGRLHVGSATRAS